MQYLISFVISKDNKTYLKIKEELFLELRNITPKISIKVKPMKDSKTKNYNREIIDDSNL